MDFLKHIAEDLYGKYNGDLSRLTIVFPNKRASLFFNQHLAELVGDKPVWTPTYTSISELFNRLSDLVVADPIMLVCRLYEKFHEITNTDESLDRFYPWGEMMISDFDDVDNNMVNASLLFSNIEDLDALTDDSYLSEPQKNAIRQFFFYFNPRNKTQLMDKFGSTWSALYPTYTAFRESLKAEGLAYPGMQKRTVCETMKEGIEDLANKLPDTDYAIIGFNVLNETEKMLFKFLKQKKNTSFYWDYDEAYYNGVFEAAQFIQEDIKIFGNEFASHPEYYRNFRKPKNIKFIASPTDDAQTRYITKWLGQNINPKEELNKSAVVLCNESMLQPVLHSIPDNVNDTSMTLNVTMGYPLAETPIYSYIDALLDLQVKGRSQSNQWKYKYAANILRHPYTKRIIGNKALSLLNTFKRNNIMFPADKYFEDNNFLSYVFTVQNTRMELTEYLQQITKLLGISYKRESLAAKNAKRKENSNIQLYTESIYNAFTMLGRIHTLLEKEPSFNVGKETYTRLLRQLMKAKSIPFHGEPAIGMQVMGILETRNLDFKNIIMLSANEGQIPQSVHSASLIPYNLRKAHGMTTIEKKVSLNAYYFFRLLQRAENITLVYNSSTDGLGKGEMSRFMLQLLVDSDKLLGSDQKIELLSLKAANEPLKTSIFKVEKTALAMDRLLDRYDLSREEKYKVTHHGNDMLLTPSALNTFLDCGLKFYLKYVSGMRIDDEVTEDVDNATFGSIFHNCMENIYKPFVGKRLMKSDLENIAKNKKLIETYVDRAFAKEFFKIDLKDKEEHPKLEYNGEQLLTRYVLIKYITQQIKVDEGNCPMVIEGVETEKYATMEVNGHKVRIGGIIDRYDKVNNGMGDVVRIVDYKTSSHEQSASSLESIFNSNEKSRAYHILQALYYSEVFTENEKTSVKPVLMYVKKPANSRKDQVKIGKEIIEEYSGELKQKYQELLKTVISDIFDKNKPFTQTNVENRCNFCDFASFCKK